MNDPIQLIRPGAQFSHVPALGCYTLSADGEIDSWQCAGVKPTPEELAQAQAALDARAELGEVQAMLEGRYTLFNRALARQDLTSQAEIQEEIQVILAYIPEVEHAARLA